LPRRSTPPTLDIGDDALHECGGNRLLLGRKAGNKNVGAEAIYRAREPLSIAHHTPQGCCGKDGRLLLGCVRQTMVDIGQTFLSGQWQDGRPYGDGLLQVPERVVRQYLVQRGLPNQHDLQRVARRVLQIGEAP
jgi:hypothetical protein